MSEKQYDPQSHDAVLSRILTNQEHMAETLRITSENTEVQIREHRAETRQCFESLNERVGSLDKFRANLKGKVAVISSGVGLAAAGAAEYLKSKFSGHS